jgi:hypothetical protein
MSVSTTGTVRRCGHAVSIGQVGVRVIGCHVGQVERLFDVFVLGIGAAEDRDQRVDRGS